MKTIDSIPTSKIQRASKLVTTGAKIGVNYLKYYGDKFTKSEVEAKENLNKNNAEDIYNGLQQVKRKCLKSCADVEYGKKCFTESICRKVFTFSVLCTSIISGFGCKNLQKLLWKRSQVTFTINSILFL